MPTLHIESLAHSLIIIIIILMMKKSQEFPVFVGLLKGIEI